MEMRMLGKTGLKVTRLGFGGIPIQRINADEAVKLVDRLIEKGINYIDTARGYTVSEELIGGAIEGRRDKFILATKSMARTCDAMKSDIQTSLKNLRTDYIDLYQVHNPNEAQLAAVEAEGGALSALLEAKEKGLIGHIGITAHSKKVFEAALEKDWVETIMFPYNIVENECEELIRRCGEKNIGFIVMKPMAGGAVATLDEDGDKNARLAMRFVLANPDVSVAIPGMYSPAEVDMNAEAEADGSPLSGEELSVIESIRKRLGGNFCRRCNYCAPCTVGISIPSVFLFAGYLERYGLEEWAKGRYATLAVKADACIECGACEARCPYNLPIIEMLKKCAEEFRE